MKFFSLTGTLLLLFFSKEEDFIGFGTARACPQKTSTGAVPQSVREAKPPKASEPSPEAKPLIGKIIPKISKRSLVIKIAPRVAKEGHDVKESPVKDKEMHKVAIKVHNKQETLSSKAKQADEQISGGQTCTTSADITKKVEAASSESAVAQSFTSFHKRQRRRMGKGVGVSAGAGASSLEEPKTTLERNAAKAPLKKVRKKRKGRFLFGYKRKSSSDILDNNQPKIKKVHARARRVFYAYVPESLPPVVSNDLQIQGQNVTLSEISSLEQVDQGSNNSFATVTSGRSSRTIKTPKRFLNEEIIPFPKGSLATWLKSQQKEDGKPIHESDYDSNSQPVDTSGVDGSSGRSKTSSKPSPGASHIEIYKNLKKLTLKLAEKKRSQGYSQEDYTNQSDDLTAHVRKKRKPKLVMEELDSPGVVRKVALVMEADVESPKKIASEDVDNNGKDTLPFKKKNNEVSTDY